MKLTGPYYRITVDHGTIYVPAAAIPSLRMVVGRLSECARVQPQNAIHAVEQTDGVIKGIMFPSAVDGWHVMLRVSQEGLSTPNWLSTTELLELRDALSAWPGSI